MKSVNVDSRNFNFCSLSQSLSFIAAKSLAAANYNLQSIQFHSTQPDQPRAAVLVQETLLQQKSSRLVSRVDDITLNFFFRLPKRAQTTTAKKVNLHIYTVVAPQIRYVNRK